MLGIFVAFACGGSGEETTATDATSEATSEASEATSEATTASTSEATTAGTTAGTTASTSETEPTTSDTEATTETTGTAACEYWVAEDGSDEGPCGLSADAPCRTLSTVLIFASAGCTIHLGPGEYSPASGEQVPWELPEDVTLLGAGSDPDGVHSLLNDGGDASAAAFDIVCDDTPDPLRPGLAVHGGHLEGFVIRGGTMSDYATVLVLDGVTEIVDIRVERGQEGIFIAGDSEVTITDVAVTDAGHAAIKPAGDSIVEIEGAVLWSSKDALEPICRATTTIRDSEAYCNGNGLEALDRAQTTMINNEVHHNINGVGARGAETRITLTGNDIYDNSFGIVEIFGRLEAGTSEAPGGNTIQGNVYGGVMINGVMEDTYAVGNTWQPQVDGADGAGLYAGMVAIDAPVCGLNSAQIEAPVPDPCDGEAPLIPDPAYQNYALNDGSCVEPPMCDPCPPLGRLILADG